jgi:pSer/pThr/pTyr-binding forkhead associated (FHA) protein
LTSPEGDAGRVWRTPTELREIILAERTGKAFLVWRAGQGGPQQLLLLEGDRVRATIGRDPDADVAIGWDTTVSWDHALLERIGLAWTVVDDRRSRNGSFVNGSRVIGRCRLADRDRLRVGSTEITYRASSASIAEATASAASPTAVITLTPTQRTVLIALCRPVHDGSSPTPATNRQIAGEVFLSVEAVKAHLRALYGAYGLDALPQNEKRASLVAAALASGVLDEREFED